MSIVAHEDDSMLFQSPDLLHDIQTGKCVRTVFVTAGDAGQDSDYWSSRELGAQAAYAQMAGVANVWTQSDAGISGHPISLMTLTGNPKITLLFMRLPDGNLDGSGFAPDESQSLQKLYLSQISQINTVDGTSSYTLSSLTSTLTNLMKAFAPNRVDTQDYVGSYGDGDHSDHHTVAYITRYASEAYTTATHTLVGYMDYGTSSLPSNVTGTDATQKANAWFAYTPFDQAVCQTAAQCNQNSYGAWLKAQYTVGTETDGPGFSYPPLAIAGTNQVVAVSSTVHLDGSQSLDPGGNPSYQWTQTSGPAVTLSSATAAQPTFTAPASPATLAFSLVVKDGSQTSPTATVTISVTPPDLALTATATASSEDVADGSTAPKAIDGVIDGYPGDSSKEWATNGGKKGSWLSLVWSSPITTNQVVLYDRPNTDDRITGATLKFSDGTTVTVPALNNDGSATTVMFPPVTTTSLLMTVTAVSSTTQNVGLAEIQVFPNPVSGPPTVTSTAPSALAQGTTSQTVTITGTNFISGPALTASFGTGVTVNSVAYAGQTKLTANVTVAATATPGPRDVKITSGDGSTATGTGAFTVDADPTVGATAPSALGQGASNQNVTVTGTGFQPGATASFGSGVTTNSTTYVSPSQLTANVSVAASATTGVRNVTVVNLDGGVGTAASAFAVNAAPTVSSASPSAGNQGAAGLSVTIAGANFVNGASLGASFGAGVTVGSVTYVSPTQVIATVTIAPGAATGARTVTVTNGDGGTASAAAAFTINPAPTVGSTSPSALAQGVAGQNVTITGTGFINGASLAGSFGAGVTVNSTTYVSATRLTANVSVAGTATPGARDVTVTGGDGSTATGAGAFTVDADPTVSGAAPGALGQGATSQNVTINGTGFQPGAAASFGPGVTVNSTTYVSATQLTASVTVPGSTATGAVGVSVSNPDGGTGSAAGAFTINPAPVVLSGPAALGQGATAQPATITGTGFQPGATVSLGAGVTASTSYVSSTLLIATVSVSANAPVGSHDVKVVNGDSGVGVALGAFTVDAGPAIASANPSALVSGVSNQNVTISGTGFAVGAVAAFANPAITVNSTTVVSGTQLTANISIASGATPGTSDVTVTNLDGGVATATGLFAINGSPSVTSTNPGAGDQGATSFNVTVNGTSFESGANASFTATGITVNSTTFVSPTRLTANISIAGSAPTGTSDVTVANPDGSTATGSAVFSVNPAPTVTGVNPGSATQGASNQNVTITGTGFDNGPALAASFGSGITTNSVTYVSATQVTANITVAGTASTGAHDVTLTNGDGSSAAAAGAFTVSKAPTIATLSPSALGQGASNQNVTITGTGFDPTSSVGFGAGITVNSTTFVSATQLTANITVAPTATTGAHDVTVNNGDGSTGTGSGAFTVDAAPAVTTVAPASGDAGATNYNVTITGTGFAQGAVASFGAGVTVNSTTFVSATRLTANIAIASGASTGTRDVTVTNTDVGSAKKTAAFTVNAAPTISAAVPNSAGAGASNLNVTITGTGFESGAAVTFSGGITVNSTTFVSATQLTTNITIPGGTTPGAVTTTLANPDGTTATGAFTVNRGPSVSAASPNSADAGASKLNVSITGSGFVTGATAKFGGGITVNSTTFVSATQLTATITIPTTATTGATSVTVTNVDGGSATGAGAFTINPVPTVTAASPNTADIGATGYNLTITGTSFESGATASFGTGVTVNSTTFVSSTQLTVNISIPTGATTGAKTLTVTNPDGTKATKSSALTVRAAPTVTTTSPTSADVGATAYKVTVTGTNFESGAAVSFGPGITVNSTTFSSTTSLSATITIPATTTPGPFAVTVNNPDNTTATAANPFTVNGPPTVTSPSTASPQIVTHSTTASFSIIGTNFESGAKVAASGGFGTATVTFVNSTQLNVTIKANTTRGTYNLTVTNPDGSKVVATGAIVNQ